MKIRLLGAHNTESNRARMAGLLIDDVLAIDAGSLTSSLSFTAQLKLKAVLLTHSHYDHIRDVPALAMNLFLRGRSVRLLASSATRQALHRHLLDGETYPDFFVRPEGKPVLDFVEMFPGQPYHLGGYDIAAIPLNHAVPAAGYLVTAADGRSLFYTGDTGPGLGDCWKQISPDLLIVELTAPDRFESFARESKHLTPGLLKAELEAFRDLRGYLPRVVTVHMNPAEEKRIRPELATVASALGASITPGREGMIIEL